MAAINSASAMEKDDGIYGQYASFAWKNGLDGWVSFGNRQIPSSVGFPVQLNTQEQLEEQRASVVAKLDALAPGARDEIRKQKIAELSPREKEVYDKSPEQRSQEENYIAGTVLIARLRPTNDEVAAKVGREKRSQAREIADELQRLDREIDMTNRYRGTVNFLYWKSRCEAEQSSEALAARELIHDAEVLHRNQRDLSAARQKYEQAWDNWAVVYEKHPRLFDSIEAKELVESIERYEKLLNDLDQKFPADFKLMKILEVTYEGAELRKRIEILHGTLPKDGSAPQEPPSKTGGKPGEKSTEEKAKQETEKKETEKPEPAKEPTPTGNAKPAPEPEGKKKPQ